jgi:hypothetical protein
MALATISSTSDFIEVIVSGVSVLGGAMAWFSGFQASQSVRIGQRPEVVSRRINEGLATGFDNGLRLAVIALILLALS